MTIYVFTGPTLSSEEARAELEAIYLPPVSQGDVYRIGLRRPRAIGIIDGYFERQPAVWHKEILWAMTQGIHVYGSASMGALRAAELTAFGMEGVGWIFENFRDGLLEDDDEVTLTHGDEDVGYRPTSEAMVNIRRTLAEAEAVSAISAQTRAVLERIAKDLFYPERIYPRILQLAAKRGLLPAELNTLSAWLPHGRIDQKREDALAMLRTMRKHLTDPEPKQVSFVLEHTIFWETFIRQAGTAQLQGDDGVEMVTNVLLLDELRLQRTAYARAQRGAVLRHLAFHWAQNRTDAISGARTRELTDKFYQALGLCTEHDRSRWLEENDLSDEEFGELMRQEAVLGWVEALVRGEVVPHVLDHLRLTGEYAHLKARALDKQRTLEAAGIQTPSLKTMGLTTESLLEWYFGSRDCPIPADVRRYASVAGFAGQHEFMRAVLREFCYALLTGASQSQQDMLQ